MAVSTVSIRSWRMACAPRRAPTRPSTTVAIVAGSRTKLAASISPRSARPRPRTAVAGSAGDPHAGTASRCWRSSSSTRSSASRRSRQIAASCRSGSLDARALVVRIRREGGAGRDARLSRQQPRITRRGNHGRRTGGTASQKFARDRRQESSPSARMSHSRSRRAGRERLADGQLNFRPDQCDGWRRNRSPGAPTLARRRDLVAGGGDPWAASAPSAG
jgi:hypothetical protein